MKISNKIDGLPQSDIKCRLHAVTRLILIMCKCVGLFPVAGLFSPAPNKLKVTLKSPYTILSLANLIGQFGLGLLALAYLFSGGINVRVVNRFLILFSGSLGTFLIQKLAWHWPKLVHEVHAIERCLPNFSQKNVIPQCRVAAAVILTCALAESLLSIQFYRRLADACAVDMSTTAYYYAYTMPAPALLFPYSIVPFIVLQFFFFQTVFILNFSDVFVVTVSIYLTSYFKEFNEMIIIYRDKYPSIWSILRVHFTKLTRLCKIIDDHISIFVLFSFGSNLSITCVQLFKVLRKDLAHPFTADCDLKKVQDTLNSYDRAIYFTFSIFFLVVRSLVTAMFASRVHSTAREPIMILYEVPSSCYNAETRRFLDQLHGSTIALSGLHFFYVTRSMILSMVTAIFTYELVMLQFSQ